MRVLHLISSGGMYGAEAVTLNVSRSLNEMRAKGERHWSGLGLFTSEAQPNTELYAAAAREGVEAFPIACRGQLDASVPGSIQALARRVKADVVHAHGYKSDLYGFIAVRGTGVRGTAVRGTAVRGSAVPIVSTCHTWHDVSVALRVYGLLDRRVLRYFAGVVAVSEEIREILLRSGVSADRIRLIANGVNLRRFGGSTRIRGAGEALRVGLVARLAVEKGIDVFVRAAAQVLTQLPKTTFVVAGEGPERAALEELIATLGIGHAFELAGRREDMPAFYEELDLLVSASRQEGMPMALLEGMAAGLPLVATPVGEVPKLIEAGCGTLVPVDDAAALATAMVEQLRNPEKRKNDGRASRDCIRTHYSTERMTEEYLALYRQVTATPAVKGARG